MSTDGSQDADVGAASTAGEGPATLQAPVAGAVSEEEKPIDGPSLSTLVSSTTLEVPAALPKVDNLSTTLASSPALRPQVEIPVRVHQKPRLLTPSSSGRRPFPKAAAIALATALAISMVTSLEGSDPSRIANGVAKLVAVLSVCSMATWLEQRTYTALLGKGRVARVVLSVLLPLAAVLLGPPVGMLVGLAGMFVGDGGTLMFALIMGALWLASAAVGTIVIVVLDVVISALIKDFRSRIQAAVLGLSALGAGVAVAIYSGGRAIAEALRNADPQQLVDSGLEISLESGKKLTADEARVLLEMPETAEFVALAFLFMAAVVSLPAILSACGKLADAVMERLHPLREAFDEVGAGRLDVRVEEGGSRELVAIGRGFNRMTENLSNTLGDLDERNRDLAEMNRATSRFVPFQFLELLRKRSIREIERGDQIELEISVLFCDIRGFTTMAEAMGPTATFRFINRYLGHMEAEIHREQGFINDIFGDGIMALFHRGADAALRAALGMLAAVDRMNVELRAEGKEPIRVGIGMNSGPLMLGTIGGKDRLSCTVVGDPANAASRVEAMTKLYGANVLITNKTRDRLEDPSRYRLRELDRVQAKGKQEPMVVYEVLDAEPPPDGEAKWGNRESFAEGLRLYREGAFDAAKRTFEACLRDAPTDGAAALYVARCARYLEHGPGADWDGVTRLESK